MKSTEHEKIAFTKHALVEDFLDGVYIDFLYLGLQSYSVLLQYYVLWLCTGFYMHTLVKMVLVHLSISVQVGRFSQ